MKESNVSNLTKALAVVSLLAPVSAQPLGIGEIELHSALNQNLKAEIRLNVAAGENPSEVSVKLAPPEKFDQAGVPWNYFLSKLRLEPVVQANGSIIVKVSSREALTEPFLDFLLEVTWPQGSMVREFTLLIDPPTAYNQPVIPVVDHSGYSAEPLEQMERPVRKARSAPRKAVRAPGNDISPQTPTSGEFGPIQKSDTLWNIATQVGQDKNVPTAQMLNALYKANPDAFINGNIDALKAGATLKIPEIKSINPGQDEQKPARKNAKPEAAQATASKKPLELVAPSEAKTAGGVIGNQPKTEENTGTDAESATHAGTEQASDGKDLELQARIEKLEQQLGMMQQLLALKDQQLATIQNNKQPQVAAPQTPVAPSSPTQPAQVAQPAPVTAEPTAPPSTPVQPAVVQPTVTPEPAPIPVVKPAPKITPPPAPPVVEDEGIFASDAFYWLGGALGTGVLGLLGWLFWRKREIDERTNTESMFASASQIQMPDSESSLSVPIMDISSTDEYDVGTVGESSFISDFTPSDFDAFDTDQNEVDPISEADVYLAYGRYQQAEELIRHAIADQPNRDECKLKLLEIFYASENKDSFARFAQELADAGKQADKPFWKKITDMAKEFIPESTLFGGDVPAPAPSAKIASVLPATTADTEIVDLEDVNDILRLDDDLSDFDLNLDMGKEPGTEDNGLDFDLGSFGETTTPQKQQPEQHIESINFDSFSASESTIDNDESDAVLGSAAESVMESFDFELTDTTAAADQGKTDSTPVQIDTSEQAATETLESFDFNFDLDSTEKADEPVATDNAAADFESFDFTNFDTSDKASATTAVAAEPEKITDIESFDFDFDTSSAEPTLDDSLKQTPDLSLDSELKLETFDFSDFDTITPKASASTESAAQAKGDFDFNFDFDTPIISTTDNEEFQLGVSDLTDMDEFETKIDLAKAYIDMGDVEAARAIAEDVVAKGSKQQQQSAQALLDELK